MIPEHDLQNPENTLLLSEATWAVLTCHSGPGGKVTSTWDVAWRAMSSVWPLPVPVCPGPHPPLLPWDRLWVLRVPRGAGETTGIVCWVSSGWTLLFCTENQPRRLQASLHRSSRQAGWASRPFPCQHSWAGHGPLTGVIGEASFFTGLGSCWWRGGSLALGCLGSSVGEASSS